MCAERTIISSGRMATADVATGDAAAFALACFFACFFCFKKGKFFMVLPVVLQQIAAAVSSISFGPRHSPQPTTREIKTTSSHHEPFPPYLFERDIGYTSMVEPPAGCKFGS